MFAVLRKAWNDSVWSKVIASGIVAAFAAGAGAVATHWDAVRDALARPLQAPLWAVLLLTIGAALLLAVGWRGRRDGDGYDPAEVDVQPNAVPIVPVEVPDEEINMQQAFQLICDRLGLEDADIHGRLAVFAELRQKARDGNIVVRGRQQQPTAVVRMYRPREAIPPEHWRNMGFEATRYMLGQTEDYIRETATYPDFDNDSRHTEPYIDLVVNRRAIERAWPKRLSSQ